jgi:tetratricopeptide (TPR) repeat protein
MNMKQPRWNWSTIAIVIAMIALVVGPVLIPRELSRWYLAAAANAYRNGDRTLGAHYVARAIEWDESVVNDRGFWIAQMDKTDPDKVLDLLEKAIQADPRRAIVARRVAFVFIDAFDYQRAVRALKMAFPDGQPWDAEDLNMLAYLRAQARVELDQALKDINQALGMIPDEPGMLDTKAWVLHGMGRDREALGILDEALQTLEKKVVPAKAESAAKNESAKTESAQTESAAGQSDESDQTSELTLSTEQLRKRILSAEARLGREMWTVAIMRFHRLRIYEALGQSQEAQQEREWLREHDVPIVDELF